MRVRGLLHLLCIFKKAQVFEKTRSFLYIFKTTGFSKKARGFDGSEVLTGQRKTTGFLKNPGLFFTFSKARTFERF